MAGGIGSGATAAALGLLQLLQLPVAVAALCSEPDGLQARCCWRKTAQDGNRQDEQHRGDAYVVNSFSGLRSEWICTWLCATGI
jgi:hypothetical protein